MNFKRRAKEQLKALEQSVSKVLIIHYSCESFVDKVDGYSPRVTAIVVKDFDLGQTYSFAIYRVAEIEGVPRNGIDEHYDRLERRMLDEFFAFVDQHKSHYYVHWNMRDANYGFQALYHRYSVLGGTPTVIDGSRLIDLAKILIDIYGSNYVEHQRLPKLIELNGISNKDLLSGREEAEAFRNKEYVRLHLSTLRKVESITDILRLQLTGSLKTNVHPAIRKIMDAHASWRFQAAELVLAVWGLISLFVIPILTLLWR